MADQAKPESRETDSSGSSVCSPRAFKVGDCVIANQADKPCEWLVAVVTDVYEANYRWAYLCDDERLDQYDQPGVFDSLADASKIEDFGVRICLNNGHYWCEQVAESQARYSDGKPRKWQGGCVQFKARPHLAKLVWPF